MIVQKNISKIPLKLSYICGTIKEQVKNIYDSKIVDTDLLKIGINNGYQQVISGPKAYISTITVGYVPNKEFYSIFGDGTPSSIYNLKNDYWAQYADTISPALYIDNKIIYEWNGALTSIGKTQYLNIASVSSNGTLDDTKEILVGSVNSISTDNQNISAQSLLTAYGKMPLTDEEQAKVCGYEVSKKISPELLDSIFKSGQASDIVAILSKYDDEAIVAINKILDKDAVAALIRDYGDDGFKVAVKGGDYLVKAINNLDDDAAELFVKTASKQSDEFFDIVKNCDDCIDDVIKHTIADGDKFPDVLLNANQKGGILRVNDVVKGANSAENILSTGRKITEGTDEWKKVSMYYEEQVDIIRNKNKGVHALGQNVSYTELNINGSKNSIQAISGSKQIDGFADLVGNKYNTIDSQRFF